VYYLVKFYLISRLQQESVILHVILFIITKIQCKNFECATKMLHIIRDLCAWKKSGIINEQISGFVIECSSVENLKTIIVKDGKLLVNKEYFTILIEECNKKLKSAHEKIRTAEEHIEKYYFEEFNEIISIDWFGNNQKKYYKREEDVVLTHKNLIDDYLTKWKKGSSNKELYLKIFEDYEFKFENISKNNCLFINYLIFKIYFRELELNEPELKHLNEIIENISPIETIFFLKYQKFIKFNIKEYLLNTKLIHKNDSILYNNLINFFS
jgi:hypothetical protein